ncbi:hypothetical protein BD324DRAFT_617369 [Kockovaella imperatae]|uniref:Nephrocystin 3-like N-terminal domain-containing protein n=1 Tax=Kockovaella imperatae TaxID=4999 RepID=A0A1Y1UQL1_9TREE|nr:hypothetical protein BD324DRAFT_617369 [Kockovaella imperatae]ORX40333.1 hypothetical protein BD324DRAFT_617369 [Kockovaella imperatae]
MSRNHPHEALLNEAILDALALPNADAREEQIVESHAGSYKWLGDPAGPLDRFLNDSSQRLFWISGRPGSGKSTLLRYLKHRSGLSERLRRWGAGHRLHIASFFFWESGLVSQRSLEGLFRSLLHQLLSSCPALIRQVFHSLYVEIQSATTLERVRRLAAWEIEDLAAAYDAFLDIIHRQGEQKVFLLLDGLDEFEGNHSEIIRLVESATRHSDVKVCVSSRPWRIFEEAFSNVAQLRLQDVTRNDMQRYVTDRLAGQASDSVIDAVVEKAEGVFFWSTIACNELQSRTKGAAVRSEDVESLPLGLDALYRHLLTEAPESTCKMAATYFSLILAREDVCMFTRNDETALVTAWELVLATHLDHDQATMRHMDSMAKETIRSLLSETIAQILDSTRRLVQFSGPEDGLAHQSVSFYHRTVRTWVRGPDGAKLLQYAKDDPHSLLLRSVLLCWRIPSSGTLRRQRNVSGWWSRIMTGFTHARLASDIAQGQIFDLLMCLNETLNDLYLARVESEDPREAHALDNWARSCFGTLESRGRTPYEDAFLALAVSFGLTSFVDRYLKEGRYEPGNGYPLLCWTTRYLFDRQSSIYPLTDPAIVHALLRFGLDPNQRMLLPKKREAKDDEPPNYLASPWKMCLESVQQALRRGWVERSPPEKSRWKQVIELFLEYNADRNVTVQTTHKDRREKGSVLLDRLDAWAGDD